jgi:hypothetical protein
MKDPFAEFDSLVKELEEGLEKTRAPGHADVEPRRPFSLKRESVKWGFRATLLAAALVLPFYLLVGSSVFLYRHYGVPTWPALRFVPKTLLAVVGAYSLYALIYLSSMNVKGGVQDTYHSLHPLLRVANSTFILFDQDLVVTDMERESEDYASMGMPVYERSLHFRQADGYAHAVDLRTIGRSAWRNWLMGAYFRAMGFRTVRHVGTADHLHVSLPTP